MPAHRAGPDLTASVDAVASMDPPPDEFVVVVDGGDPRVSAGLDPSVRVLDVDRGGPAAARNAGVRATDADVIAFVDSDVVAGTDLVSRLRAALSADDAPDALIGSYDDSPAVTTTVSRFRNLLHHWTHQRSAGTGHTFWGACGAVRRTAFDHVGGFDETYRDASIEDIELGERLTRAGYRIEVVPSIQVKHLKRWTLANMIHTDVVKRGVPWSRLMIADGSIADDLNTTRRARVTVAVAASAWSVAASAVAWPRRRWGAATLALALAGVLTWRDRPFLSFLARRHDLAFALRCAPLMWVHHLCAAVSFGWAVLTWPLTARGSAGDRP